MGASPVKSCEYGWEAGAQEQWGMAEGTRCVQPQEGKARSYRKSEARLFPGRQWCKLEVVEIPAVKRLKKRKKFSMNTIID